MSNVVTTTSTLSPTVKSYYEKKFLMVAEKNLVYEQLGMQGRVPKKEGKKVVWTRQSNLATVTSALSEGTDPTAVGLSAVNVTADLAEYGKLEQISSMLELTAIDGTVEEAIERLAYNAAESIDTVIRNVIAEGGQVQYANTAAARNSLNPADTFSVKELRKSVRTLNRMCAKPHTNGEFVAIIHPDVELTYQLLRVARLVSKLRKLQGSLIEIICSQARIIAGRFNDYNRRNPLGSWNSLNCMATCRVG